MAGKSRQPFRNGRVHVCARMCKTCIFRPGNLMHLNEGVVEEMVEDSNKKQSAIFCHSTLDGPKAICRGFYEKHPTTPLRLAAALELITFQEVE